MNVISLSQQSQNMLPSKLDTLQDNMLPSIYAAYAPDLQETFDTFKTEIARWRVRWSIAVAKPCRLQETLKHTNKDLYPCLFAIFGVLLTMPPTSASCERSFSGIKNFLRTTMRSDRLSSLAMLHSHKSMDIDVDRVINVFGSQKCRKLDFF